MDDNKVKEMISEAFFSLIVAKSRFKMYKSSSGDHGIDLLVNPVLKRIRTFDNSISYIDSGEKLDIQLKCTTESKIKNLDNGNLGFNLKVKNYEDLIHRRDSVGVPLLLIIFILPDNEDEWLEIFHDQLLLRRCGYWYLISEKEDFKKTEHMKKSSQIQIELSPKNKLTLDFQTLFNYTWISKKTL